MTTTCKDCIAEGITSNRKAPHPGPRCVTHHRARKKMLSSAAHGKRVEAVYGITENEYWELYRYQNGVCFICRRANGRSKRLSVDHDHSTGEVRQLLCSGCNRGVLGYLRDDVGALERAIESLSNPPARQCFGGPRYVPE